MVDSKGFILCPVCHNKTRLKVRPDTTFKNFPLFCPKYKQVTMIDMGPGNQIKRIWPGKQQVERVSCCRSGI